MSPRYRVTLTREERKELEALLTHKGRIDARRFIHAQILLLCDCGEDGPAWNVADVATALSVTSRSIEHIKKRFVKEGLKAALERKPRENPPREVRFGCAFDVRLLAMVFSDAPDGRDRWKVRLLADKVVEFKMADNVSHMTVQRILKKTNLILTSLPTGKSLREKTRRL